VRATHYVGRLDQDGGVELPEVGSETIPGHPIERLAAFAARGADDDPADWVPMWISRKVALALVHASDSDEWTHDDDELNEALHEVLEEMACQALPRA
jgi:hypothetical protein